MSEAHLSELPGCCRWQKFSLMFLERKGRREGCFLSRVCAQRQEAWEPFSIRPVKADSERVPAVMHNKLWASSRCPPGTSSARLTGSLRVPSAEGCGRCAARQRYGAALRTSDREGRHGEAGEIQSRGVQFTGAPAAHGRRAVTKTWWHLSLCFEYLGWACKTSSNNVRKKQHVLIRIVYGITGE